MERKALYKPDICASASCGMVKCVLYVVSGYGAS
jgi:hypothetical protein